MSLKHQPFIPTRQSDERILDWLEKRADGVSSKAIGLMHGVSDAQVRAITNLVMSKDVAESGEPMRDVIAAYRPAVVCK